MKQLLALALTLYIITLTGCNSRPTPLKQGIISVVQWKNEENGITGFYRQKMPKNPIALQGGQYDANIYGYLYASHLEVQFIGRKDGKTRIIPFDKITMLEFGDAGITFEN